MIDNATYSAWELDIARHADLFDEEEARHIHMSPSTYRRLQDEIWEMPQSELPTLPEDIQDWIVELRPEIKAGLDRLQESIEIIDDDLIPKVEDQPSNELE